MNSALRHAFQQSKQKLWVRKCDIVLTGVGLSMLMAHDYWDREFRATKADNDVAGIYFTGKHHLGLLKHFLNPEVGEQELEQAKSNASKFPTLNTKLWKDGQHLFFPLNSDEPIPINNDLFVGQVLLSIRPMQSSDDPNFSNRVDKATDTFHIQFQGRFKRPIEKDKLFVGAELAHPKMSLGSVTKKLSSLILHCLAINMGAKMKHSFGTPTELPHISFPLHKAMQKVVVSEAGESAPPLGNPFPSEQQQVGEKWNTEDLYSFSFSASSIDLTTWKVLYPWEINLTRFWSDSPCRLVVYYREDDNESKKYLFNLHVEHLPTSVETSTRETPMLRNA